MKVAFITHGSNLYGANRSLLNLIDGLNKYDVSAYVISPSEGKLTEALKVRGVPVEVLPIQRWISGRPSLISSKNLLKYLVKYVRNYAIARHQALERLFLNFSILKSLTKKLRDWQIDVVYTNTSVIPTGWLAAKRLGIPHVWHLREFGYLDHGFPLDWGLDIHKLIIWSSDLHIAVSEAIRDYFFLKKMDRKRVYVIYNGVASESKFDDLYRQNQQIRVPQQPYTFVLIGNIQPNKGQEVAIRALALVVEKFPTVRLLIVGSGDLASLKRLANNLNLENNVEFWGYIEDPYKAYLAADAVLMCSKNEAMGRVTVEGMSACLPVIGYDNFGTSELIEHEHTGLLYSDGFDELAKCMIRLVDNPEWGRQIGHNAWHVARQKFTIESYAQAVYTKVLLSVKENSNPLLS